MTEKLHQELKLEVDERQEELDYTLQALEKDAKKYSLLSKYFRVSIIFLGSVTATKAVFPENELTKFIFAAFGVLIATLSGTEASFGFLKRSLEEKKLAAKCKSLILDIDCKIPQSHEDSLENRIKTIKELLNNQNKALKCIQGKAAEIGLNITRKVRKLR